MFALGSSWCANSCTAARPNAPADRPDDRVSVRTGRRITDGRRRQKTKTHRPLAAQPRYGARSAGYFNTATESEVSNLLNDSHPIGGIATIGECDAPVGEGAADL